VSGVIFYSLAQFTHVRSQVFDVVFELGSPYGAQYFLVRDGSSLIAHEKMQDIELRASQRDRVASFQKDAALAAKGHIANDEGGIR
jgi:hypothetical protein